MAWIFKNLETLSSELSQILVPWGLIVFSKDLYHAIACHQL